MATGRLFSGGLRRASLVCVLWLRLTLNGSTAPARRVISLSMPEVIDFRNFLVVVAAVTALFVFGATTRSERGRERGPCRSERRVSERGEGHVYLCRGERECERVCVCVLCVCVVCVCGRAIAASLRPFLTCFILFCFLIESGLDLPSFGTP